MASLGFFTKSQLGDVGVHTDRNVFGMGDSVG
jgi:hypothetical protein